MASPLEDFLPHDPGAFAFFSQPEVQHLARQQDEDEEEDDDEEDDDEDEEEEEDTRTQEELRAELLKTNKALKRANDSSKKRRLSTRELREENERLKSESRKPKPKPDDDKGKGGSGLTEADLELARTQAREEAVKETNLRILTSEAKSGLIAAGANAERVARLTKLIDFDDLEVTKGGDVIGLEDAIDELKDDYPELFTKAKNKRRSVAGGDDRDGDTKNTRTKGPTVSERQAAMILGKPIPK